MRLEPIEHVQCATGHVQNVSENPVAGQVHPEIAKLQLIDYRVRILDAAHGTDAVTRVLVETADGETSWETVGVGANIVEASWEALVDGVTYGLLRHDATPLPT